MIGSNPLSKSAIITSWVCQIVAAVILAQTLYFKFTGEPESVYIFSTLKAEPWGRIASGVFELIAVILLVNSKTAALGAVLAMGLMVGAIGAHLTKLGIAVQGDGGLLFGLGVVTLLAATMVAVIRRKEIPIVGGKL